MAGRGAYNGGRILGPDSASQAAPATYNDWRIASAADTRAHGVSSQLTDSGLYNDGRLSGACSGVIRCADGRFRLAALRPRARATIRPPLYIGLPYPFAPTHATLASMNDGGYSTGSTADGTGGVSGGASSAGDVAGSPSPDNAPEAWQRVADLVARTHQRQARAYLRTHYEDGADYRYVPRPQGGSPELWVTAALAKVLATHYPGPEGPPVAAPVAAPAWSGSPGDAPAGAPVATAGAPDAAERSPDAALEAVARAYDLALTEARRAGDHAAERAEAAERRAAELASELKNLRERVGELERRSEVAETQTRRAREESDRFRSELERTRLAWHQWRRALDGWGRVALFRRRLPAEPPEFTAGLAIEDKERRSQSVSP